MMTDIEIQNEKNVVIVVILRSIQSVYRFFFLLSSTCI